SALLPGASAHPPPFAPSSRSWWLPKYRKSPSATAKLPLSWLIRGLKWRAGPLPDTGSHWAYLRRTNARHWAPERLDPGTATKPAGVCDIQDHRLLCYQSEFRPLGMT